jgi:hypothetical protein
VRRHGSGLGAGRENAPGVGELITVDLDITIVIANSEKEQGRADV